MTRAPLEECERCGQPSRTIAERPSLGIRTADRGAPLRPLRLCTPCYEHLEQAFARTRAFAAARDGVS